MWDIICITFNYTLGVACGFFLVIYAKYIDTVFDKLRKRHIEPTFFYFFAFNFSKIFFSKKHGSNLQKNYSCSKGVSK